MKISEIKRCYANLLKEIYLPRRLHKNGEGVFDPSSKDFENVEDFTNAVMSTTGARDMQFETNTLEVSTSELKKGDMIINRWDDGPASHVQLVTGTDGDVVKIHQGNTHGLSSDPTSIFYAGTTIQTATWNRSTDFYKRNDSPASRKNFSKVENIQGRRWNFQSFNSAVKSPSRIEPSKGTRYIDY